MTISIPSTDTPGLVPADADALAWAGQFADSLGDVYKHPELLDGLPGDSAPITAYPWAALAGRASTNTFCLLSIIERLAGRVTDAEARIAEVTRSWEAALGITGKELDK